MNDPATARYHHGDLRQALVTAATELARTGGPEAVVLREAARRVGVSPSAAYRHFPSLEGLFAVVGSKAREALGRAMLERLAGLPRDHDERRRALVRFRATGAAYVDFALTEQGLFRAAFVPCDPALVVRDDPSPYAILSDAIDGLASAGVLPPARRPHAEEVAWSAVHGVSMILGDGLLGPVGDAEREDIVGRVLDSVVSGLVVQG
jgi:AcrR family transcriptional regulator